MATPMYMKLFQTIQDIEASGKTKLSADERAIIERETADLLRKSQMKNYRFASKVPQGFEDLLGKLKSADAEEAYTLVKDFMDELEEGHEEKEEGHEEKEEGNPFGKGKEDKEENDFIDEVEDEVGDKPDFGKKDDGEDKSEKGEKPDFGKKDKEEKSEKKDEKKDEKKPERGEKPDFGKKEEKPDFGKEDKDEKEMIMARIRNRRAQMSLDKEMPGKGDGPKMDEKGPHGLGKGKDEDGPKGKPEFGKDKDKLKMKDLQKKPDKDNKPSMDEMGIMDSEVDPTLNMRASKIRVKVTAERNIVAYHEDYGPVFVITPSTQVKRSKTALVRLANKAYGLAVYQGFKVAAKKLGGRLLKLADVDEDVEVVTEEKPETPIHNDVVDKGEDEIEQSREEAADDITEGDDTVIKGAKRIKRTRPRHAAEGDVTNEAEFVTEETYDKGSNDVTKDADDEIDEAKETPAGDVLEGDEVDFKTAKRIEANYRKLYAARLKKAQEDFVRKFSRCMRIASQRMLLNHDKNPMKIALTDVLMSDNVELEDGELFRPMPVHVAVQLTELASSEGHSDFVNHLMDRTADLMDKGEEYLADAESDIANLAPRAPEVQAATHSNRAPRQAAKLRKAASTGNFGLPGHSTTQPQNITPSLRGAVISGDFKVGRALSKLKS